MQHSAGIICYRFKNNILEVFLTHPGGPFYIDKDDGFWSIPKGLIDKGETILDAAKREFFEETSTKIPENIQLKQLIPVVQSHYKTVYPFAANFDFDEKKVVCDSYFDYNGHKYAENDGCDWFNMEKARIKIKQGQLGVLEQLNNLIGKINEEKH